MNEEIIINFGNQQGLRCSDFDMTTGKVIVNDIEITSVEDWEKVTKSLVDLQQENQRLKEMKYKTLIDLQERIDKALKLIQENVKPEYGIIDVATVWEIESVLEGGKDE